VYRRIAIENLNVGGMVRNCLLARPLFDSGFFEYPPIEYKARFYGTTVLISSSVFARLMGLFRSR